MGKGARGDGHGTLTGLQALRAAAALSVAAPHVWHEADQLYGPSWDMLAAFPWNAGVDVFFVISGFVMAYATGFARPGGRRVFLSRRIARIVPLYWLTTLLVLGLAVLRPDAVLSVDATPGRALASLLFWPGTRPDGRVVPIYSLGWTLNYEMFFYLVLAAFVGLGRRAAVAGCVAALAALVTLGQVAAPLPVQLAFWGDPIVLEFGAGLVLGTLRAEGTVLGPGGRCLLGLAAAALFGWASGGIMGPIQPAVHLAAAACLVAACALAPPHRGGPAPRRAATALGDASYALYLLHPFAMRAVRLIVAAAANRLGTGLPSRTGFVLLCLAVAIALALTVHRWVERPLTRLARRTLAAIPPRPVPAPAA